MCTLCLCFVLVFQRCLDRATSFSHVIFRRFSVWSRLCEFIPNLYRRRTCVIARVSVFGQAFSISSNIPSVSLRAELTKKRGSCSVHHVAPLAFALLTHLSFVCLSRSRSFPCVAAARPSLRFSSAPAPTCRCNATTTRRTPTCARSPSRARPSKSPRRSNKCRRSVTERCVYDRCQCCRAVLCCAVCGVFCYVRFCGRITDYVADPMEP